MAEFFPEIEVSNAEAEAIARGLFAVARADGEVHEREVAIIAEFYADTSAHPSNLGALERAPRIEPGELAAALATRELRVLFVKTALLLAYTDNGIGPGESELIGEYAAAFQMSEADVTELREQAKEFLVGQLAHLGNVDGVAAIAKELD